jgi:hypothetical protein
VSRHPFLVLGWFVSVGFAAAGLVRFASAGDGWRTAGFALVLALLFALRRDLTEDGRV